MNMARPAFIIMGGMADDKVILTATSNIVDIEIEQRSQWGDFPAIGTVRRLSDPEETLTARVLGRQMVVSSFGDAWDKLTELWVPPDPTRLAMALTLGKKPAQPCPRAGFTSKGFK
jgi:hypothetical protein